MNVYIKTYGCQMNERDSDAAAAMLAADGHDIVQTEEAADLIILNTCSVRDQAERKAIGKLGILKRLKEDRPNLLFGIMGCMAQSRGTELLKTIPHLNFAVGTDKIHELPEIVSDLAEKHKIESTGHDNLSDVDGIDAHTVKRGFSDFISIMRGCNRFCTYCIVPYARGRERSRSPESVVEEARKLAESGVKEIMLLGQNVAAYGIDGIRFPDDVSPFADLLESLAKIEGIKRIRFTSPHPAFFNTRLIDAVANTPKVCNSVHLPLQSGSDRILQAMNRPYTAKQYMHIVNELKRKCGEIAFSTDIIVGFPGETDEDFEETRRILNEVGYDNAYIFKYSPRKGTKAAELLADDVPQAVKEERNQILLADLAKTSERANDKFVGRTLEVLAEGVSKRNSARWCGRTELSKLVVFEPDEAIRPGELVQVHIKHATAMTLFGDLVRG